MRKLVLTILASTMSLLMFAQENENEFVGKTIVVLTIGNQYDYDANKRVLRPSGNQGRLIAESNAKFMTDMLTWYGGKVLNQHSQESIAILSEMKNMKSDADFSLLRTKAKELGVDYILWEDLEWMMYRDQLFIYEYQIKLLDVAKNVIDRQSTCLYMNAQKDARDIDGATARLTNEHVDVLKEMISRITPRLWGIVGVSKKGKKIDMLPVTFSGYYRNDIFYIYDIGTEKCNLNGNTSIFVTMKPLAKSTKFDVQDGSKYVVDLDSKIKFAPSIIASAGNLITANIPGYDYSFIPIVIESLDGANANTYDDHNKEITNYALYNAIHNNRMLKVLADPSDATLEPLYKCELSNYSELKNIVKVKLTVTDLVKKTIIKDVVIESHTSNLDNVLSSLISETFGTPVALGEIKKKTISYYVQYPIASKEGDKFLLLLDDESRTPIVLYNLVQWQGQKYILEEEKILNKKIAKQVGKDNKAKYLLIRYSEPIKNPKKDKSEFNKVTGGINKLFDMISK